MAIEKFRNKVFFRSNERYQNGDLNGDQKIDHNGDQDQNGAHNEAESRNELPPDYQHY